ncbi:polysaccharide deacetylase family protein [bacterium]|nr:polysaccharide deacetylase family protein [bacterium]
MTTARVPIFMFHHVLPKTDDAIGSSLVVSLDKLEQIVTWFLKRDFESMTMGQLIIGLMTGDASCLKRKFVLTFDDGARDNFEHACKSLLRLGCTGTFFVPTDYIGGTSAWRKGKRAFEIMTEDEIVELHGNGFEIGSHACCHTDLTALSNAELARQVNVSREILSSIIGADVLSFAYPYGLFDQNVIASVRKSGYAGACTTLRGSVQDSRHGFALKRIMVTEATSRVRLRYFISGLLDFEHRKEYLKAVSSRQNGGETE